MISHEPTIVSLMRANRAVIFDSDLFHETDMTDFEKGYENRRINITLLYGWRGGVKGRIEKAGDCARHCGS